VKTSNLTLQLLVHGFRATSSKIPRELTVERLMAGKKKNHFPL
jgi:hypothetical protein